MKQAERPRLHRWTRREYERLIDHGFLDEDDPIELLTAAQDGGAPRREGGGAGGPSSQLTA